MTRALALAMCAVIAGCAFGRAPEGNPSPTDAARARLHDIKLRAAHAATDRAVASARSTGDARTIRKALDLLASSPDDLGGAPDTVAFVVERGLACDTWQDADRALHAGKLDKQALDVETHALDTCKDARGGVAAAGTLRALSRCPDAVAIAQRAYPLASTGTPGERIEVLDSISACSDATNLEANLKFVGADAMRGYLADRSARMCESRCSDARSDCNASCGNWSECYSRCSALENACAAGCQ